MASIICTVTNDLSYDQRMIRICTSLANAGYTVTLTGRKLPSSLPLKEQPFAQKRLYCFFKKGAFFYAEYNIRLLIWLLFQKADCICAIDLDTIIPCLLASKLKGTKRVYDAHELFCEMKEIVTRPSRYKIWKWIERKTVPQFSYGYTVCSPIAKDFREMYGVQYEVIRNVPLKNVDNSLEEETIPRNKKQDPFFLYQGAVNEGRSFETLIPAMKEVKFPLHIYGDGNYLRQTEELIASNQLQDKVKLLGKRTPAELKQITPTAYAGITLFENNGRSNYLSLANRFFDYIMAGIPQVCIDFPSYRELNDQYGFVLLIPDTQPETIVGALNHLSEDVVLYQALKRNCLTARESLNWQEEEKKLIAYYQIVFE